MTRYPVIDRAPLTEPADGELLPSHVFTSPALFELEMRQVFGRSWVHVADRTDLTTPGDFVTSTIGRVPVIVVHGHDGEVRAFLNACRHRGATLAEGSGNCGKVLTCPYHAWSYKTDGQLAGVPHREEFEAHDLTTRNLVQIRTATLGPLVFACLDGDAPDFDAWAGELVAAVETARADAMMAAFGFDYDVDVNWKVYVENGLDGYHVGFVHDILGQLIEQGAGIHHFEEHASYTYAPLADAFAQLGTGLDHLEAADASRARFGMVFPNLIPVITPGEMSYLRIDPVGPERIRLRARSFDLGGDLENMRNFRKSSFDRTNQQDIAVVRRVQEGHRADLPPGIHSSHLERRIAHFERLYVRALGGRAAPERAGMQVL